MAATLIGIPALAFTLWPLLARRAASRALLPLPPDAREQLVDRRRSVLGALRELEFEHDAGHVSDDDYAELRARYEAEAADVLTELDRLGPLPAPPSVASPTAARRGWRHPAAVGLAATALLAFGVALGVGVTRYTTPDTTSTGAPFGATDTPMPGSRPLAPPLTAGGAPGPAPEGASGRPLSPEMLQGMLQAARQSLFAERYGEAFAAYQAVLKRDPQNVDALTHLGLVAAIAGHGDDALRLIDRALAVDANYPPALLYRGQILYEVKGDPEAAVRSWERFLAVAPPGEEHERVRRMIAEARKPR